MRRSCPTHPSQPAEECGYCERLIAEHEGRELWAPEDAHASRVDAEAYERWLDRWAP